MVAFSELVVSQARVACAAVGNFEWKRRPGQKGPRILCLDGGGTRGVISIAILKELLARLGIDKRPFELFDMICGTSTGGIITALLGVQRMDINDVDTFYFSLIESIFSRGSTTSLINKLAKYADNEDFWEHLLENISDNELLIDSNRYNVPKVFMVCSNFSVSPTKSVIFTNYNYPPTSIEPSAYFRVNTRTAVRATSAAPPYFRYVTLGNHIIGDGALTNNNPTGEAFKEARVISCFYSISHTVLVELCIALYVETFRRGARVDSFYWNRSVQDKPE